VIGQALAMSQALVLVDTSLAVLLAVEALVVAAED
jgi:hypothetical protein